MAEAKETKWYLNPYLDILAIVIAIATFFEIAPLCTDKIGFLHSALPMKAMTDTNFSTACLGGFIMYLCLLPKRRSELYWVLSLGLVIDGWMTYTRMNYMIPEGLIFYVGIGFFLSAIVAIISRVFTHHRLGESDKRLRALEVLGLIIAMPIMYSCNGLANSNSAGLVYDPMLLAADGALGTQISFKITAALRSSAIVRGIFYCAYFYLALFMMLAQLFAYKRQHLEDSEWPKPYVIPAYLFLIVSILGISCYKFMPGVGTQAFCGTGIFPYGPIPVVTEVPHAVEAPPQLPRDCMPSLHLTWILCAFFSISRLKKSYLYVGGVTVFLVWLSAFSVGHHWFSDFVVALPFTACCLGLCSYRAQARWRCLAVLVGGSCAISLMSLYKYNIAWVMDHQVIYLALIAIIDIGSWAMCLSLLPPRQKRSSSKG